MAASSIPHDILAKAMNTSPVDPMDWLVVAPSILTILGGALCLMGRKQTRSQPRIGLLFLTLLVAVNIALLVRVLDRGVITMVMGNWLPPFGIAFTVDVLGASLSLIASVVAWCAGLYGSVSFDRTARRYGFYPFLLLLMTGVSGAFLTGDIFNLYVWFEVLLISSYGLLVLGNEKVQLDGSVKYGILNLIGTNLFLIATALIYGMFGTLNMADLARKAAEMNDVAGPLSTIAALYFLAFAMKAAAFPVNFWLPASYHTPNVVVSAVFAGLLTKVGVYALMRVFILILPMARADLADLIGLVAIATMITGALGALAQGEVRRILGYMVITGIGSMLAGIAIGTTLAIAATIFYAIHSIIVMTALYMAAGIIHRMTGTYQLRQLGGLYDRNWAFAALFLILCFAVSGLPPFSGFWPKVSLIDAAFAANRTAIAIAILAAGFLSTLAMGRVWIYAFWRGGPEGTPDGTLAQVQEVKGQASVEHLALWVPLVLLTALVVGIGLMPEGLFQLVARGASGVMEPFGHIRAVFGAL